jgi:hypothetical protein
LVVPGGIVIVDNFGVFPGETDVVRRLIAASEGSLRLEEFPFTGHVTYFVAR